MTDAVERAAPRPTVRFGSFALAAAALLLGGALILGIFVGPFPLGPGEIMHTLARGAIGIPNDDIAGTVLFNIRLPRVLMAALIGAALSAAGAAYQVVFRNPLVSPDILGVSAGAGLGAVLGIFLGLPVIAIQGLGFGFGLATVGLVLTITATLRGHGDVLVMVLCGIAVGALAGAGISLLKILADPDNQLPAITFSLLGSLAGIKQSDLALTLVPVIIGLSPLMILRWRIGVLSLGEDEARALGIETGRIRFVVVLGATLVTAAAVSAAGIVGWIGLMVPHMARLMTGPRFDRLLPVSTLLGAPFLVIVDMVARSLATTEIPLGILTAVIGAPVFLILLSRRRHAWD